MNDNSEDAAALWDQHLADLNEEIISLKQTITNLNTLLTETQDEFEEAHDLVYAENKRLKDEMELLFDDYDVQCQCRDMYRADNVRLREALEKLARLGNGERYGNSDGNMIARDVLERK